MNPLCQGLMSLQSELESRLCKEFLESEVQVSVSGNHATIDVTSDKFETLNRVQRQQSVYACINDLIQSGDLHAVVINAHTSSEI